MSTDASLSGRRHLSEAGFRNIPLDWDVVNMADLLHTDRGISVGVMYPGPHVLGGTPLIKAGDLSGNAINDEPSFCISPDKHYEYRRTAFEGGELLMTLVGDVGQCAIVRPEMAGWNAARAVAVMRFRNPSDASYIRQCLLSSRLNT